MWVFDATPLIYLAKVDGLDLVETLDGECVIPERVHAEVVETGREQGYPDARRIERAIDADRFQVLTVEETPRLERLQQNPHLSDADAAVLAAASDGGVAVMDETYGRDVASTENITTRGTAFIVLRAAADGAITTAEAQRVIDDMVEAGWYCAPDVYAKLLRKLDSMSD